MSPASEKIMSQALELPREEREELVERLLRSLDDEAEDDLDPEDRAALDAAIARSEEQIKAGQVFDADEVLDELEQLQRRRRRRR